MNNSRKRTKKQTSSMGGKKKLWLGLGIGTAVLLAAYLVLCTVPGRGDTFYKGTSVNGIEIGGMKQDEAQTLLETELSGVTTVNEVQYSIVEVRPEVEGVEPYQVDLSQSLTYDIASLVERAYAHDRGGMFLSRGLRYLVGAVVGGKQYTVLPHAVSEEAVAEALTQSGILELNTTVETTWQLQEETLDVTMGTSGFVVDSAELTRQIMERTANGNYEPITCPLAEQAPQPVTGEQLHTETAADPKNATLNVAADRSYTVVDAVRGVDFDVPGADNLLSAAAEGETVQIPLQREEPSITTQMLQDGLFRDVLGGYTTTVGGSAGRRSNVRLCAEKCNGYIVLPGEQFSYNEVVGKRTVEAGFSEAPAYNQGQTVQEVGGGVCQGSSTLYCAVLYSNLEIVERRNHSYPAAYTPIGMDATVSWGWPEFIFKNNTDYPIRVIAWYKDGKTHYEIQGTKVSDFKVEIVSETVQTIPPTRKEVPDPTLPVGQEVIEDKGHTGYKVQTYRKVYDGNGKLISNNKEAFSTYRMTEQVVRVGTMQVPPAPPAETPVPPAEAVPAPAA